MSLSPAGRLVKNLVTGPHPHTVSDSIDLGWGPRMCISNKFPEAADTVGLGTTVRTAELAI